MSLYTALLNNLYKSTNLNLLTLIFLCGDFQGVKSLHECQNVSQYPHPRLRLRKSAISDKRTATSCTKRRVEKKAEID